MRWSLCLAILLAACTRDTKPGEPALEPPAQAKDALGATPDAAAGAARARPTQTRFADLRGWRMLGWADSLSNAKKALDEAGIRYDEQGGRGTFIERRRKGRATAAPHMHHRFTTTLALADGVTRLHFTDHRLVSAVVRGRNVADRRVASKALRRLTARYGTAHRAEKRGTFDASVWENANTRLIAYVVTDTSHKNLVTHWLIERWEPAK